MTTQGGHAPRNSTVKQAIDRAIRAQGIALPPDPPSRLSWQQKGAIANAKKRGDRLEAELVEARRDLRQAQKRIRQLEQQVNRILKPPARLRSVA